MSHTAPRYTVQTVLDFILRRNRARTEASAPYELHDFAEAVDRAAMVSHLEGKPFHMAADLLGVSPALLSGILAMGSGAELANAYGLPEGLERTALEEGSSALHAAAAMYEAENAKPAPVPGPDMRNDALADLLEEWRDKLSSESWPGFEDAMNEAAQRIRERGEEEE